ncbi:unnamed protein product, partial [Choristocarpus tenellus]
GTILYKIVLGLVCLSGVLALAGSFRKTKESIALETDVEYPFTTAEHPVRPGPLWGQVSRPYPTGAWWLNLVIGQGDGLVAPLPYAVKATEEGVGVSYSAMRRSVSSEMIQDIYGADLTLTSIEDQRGHNIMGYDNLTVTLQHNVHGGGYYRTLLARGSPYITLEYLDVTPQIHANAEILKVNGEVPKSGSSYHGVQFKLILSNRETWMVYTSGSVTWKL